MMDRVWIVVGTAVLLPGWASAARFQTQNFVINARSAEVARQVGELAERFRREKAVEWLGFELQPWPTPCTVDVKLTMGGAGGATSFDFENGVVRRQHMSVEGPLHRILDSVLPHEITHTIFAAKFRRPLPRWADEGGSVLSEDHQERARHDLLVRQICRSGRLIPLRRLFVLTEYPRDVMALYAEGFSIANYLVSLKGRQVFLDFVAEGQQTNWDTAGNRYYGFQSVDELQKNWIDWLIRGVGTGADEESEAPRAIAAATPRTPTRVVRGQSPDDREWSPSENSLAASAPRNTSPGRLPPGKPVPHAAGSAPVQGVSRIPTAEESDSSKQGTLIPIAVGRARRTSGQ